ncbi:multidrug efflux SMR transporter [Pseudonocardia eucalypti]|uniref:Multidrug efflux SMR transporter n=1 Tax=Pseudonocardia eucalypti TaxID=648755 RepID=A0ABP9Q188_9PSEU|nr:quaternary ammonium compound-resistance protein SugE [Pseudonocardia eucalypti]
MSAGWTYLLLAGVVEIAWVQSIPPTQGLSRPWPTLLCLVLCLGVIYLLALAARAMPISTAYLVFVGMGAAGAVLLGLLVHHDRLTLSRMTALALITAGVLLAHATTEHA